MNEPDVSRKVSQWIRYGEDDLRLARHAGAMGAGCPWRLVAFHAQQAAEKWLKAVLVHHRLDFPYTHNIRLLLELCAPLTGWGDLLEEAEELTPFAISFRYPGEDEEIAPVEAARAIALAEKVREAARRYLQGQGVPWDDSSAG